MRRSNIIWQNYSGISGLCEVSAAMVFVYFAVCWKFTLHVLNNRNTIKLCQEMVIENACLFLEKGNVNCIHVFRVICHLVLISVEKADDDVTVANALVTRS